jgi:hypothetical protein
MALSFSEITSLPEAPQKTDSENFAAKADAFVAALDGLQSDLNTFISELNDLGSGLDTETTIAEWEIAPHYDIPDVVYGSDYATYRTVTDDNFGNDPVEDDGTNWIKISSSIDFVDALGSVSGSVAVNPTGPDTITMTVTAAATIVPTSWAVGRTVTLVITNGGSNVTWPSGTKWPGGSEPALSSSGTDRVVVQKMGASEYHAVLAGKAYA